MKSSLCRGSRAAELLGLLLHAVGEDQPFDQVPAVTEEHVLGTAQADSLGAEGAGTRGVLGIVRVGPYGHPARAVGVAHDPVDRLDQLCVGTLAVSLEVADDG